MTERYNQEVNDLIAWFSERLPRLGKVQLLTSEYKAGVDSLQGYHAKLRDAAFIEWLTFRNYELSYNQACLGFFHAAINLGLLEIDGLPFTAHTETSERGASDAAPSSTN